MARIWPKMLSSFYIFISDTRTLLTNNPWKGVFICFVFAVIINTAECYIRHNWLPLGRIDIFAGSMNLVLLPFSPPESGYFQDKVFHTSIEYICLPLSCVSLGMRLCVVGREKDVVRWSYRFASWALVFLKWLYSRTVTCNLMFLWIICVQI